LTGGYILSLSIDVIYLDFAKAFDKVPHQRLLSKTEAHGIDGKVWDWIKEWLDGRKQKVHVYKWSKVRDGDLLQVVFHKDQFWVQSCS